MSDQAATVVPTNYGRDVARKMLRKVPEVTLWFWIIKILCTTVGETAADFLNENLKLGLTNTTYIMAGLLIVVLFFQFRSRKYVPGLYWLVVVLISIVGTLITDNMVENLGISLVASFIGFSIALALTFTIWYASEKTLSIHSIYTTRREAFYWLAILFTFALGTAGGDLLAEKLAVGYLISVFIFGGMIAVVTLAHFKFGLNGVFTFWAAYILTRPLGASIGDLMSQDRGKLMGPDGVAGGLGLGVIVTSAVFLSAILAVVMYLSISKADVEELHPSEEALEEESVG